MIRHAHTLQHIEYAKSKSYATLKREDPEFVPPTSIHAQDTASRLGNGVLGNNDKRSRDDRMDEDPRDTKREKVVDDDEGEEMEIEDEDDVNVKGKATGTLDMSLLQFDHGVYLTFLVDSAPPVVSHPSARLLCTNLPLEVTDDVLSVLFQQYAITDSSYNCCSD